MQSSQTNRLLGILLVALGLTIFFLFTYEFLFRIFLAAVGLFIVKKGLQMQGYPASRLFFMAQQWRSRF